MLGIVFMYVSRIYPESVIIRQMNERTPTLIEKSWIQ